MFCLSPIICLKIFLGFEGYSFFPQIFRSQQWVKRDQSFPFGATLSHLLLLYHAILLNWILWLTVIWLWYEITEKKKYPWGIKENHEVKCKKTWEEMSPLNFTPLFCTIPLHYYPSPSREVCTIWSFFFLSHYHSLIIFWLTAWFTTFSHFGSYIEPLEKEDS